MPTIAVDLASHPKKTALCELYWTERAVKVTRLVIGVTDEASETSISSAARWQWTFHLDGPAITCIHLTSRSTFCRDSPHPLDLRWLSTDRHVFEQTGLRPLSVSTNKIGVAASRWVGIERRLTRGIRSWGFRKHKNSGNSGAADGFRSDRSDPMKTRQRPLPTHGLA